MKSYDTHLNKLVTEAIETKCNTNTILLGLQEIAGKLDTLIALEQVAAQSLQPLQEPQRQKQQ